MYWENPEILLGLWILPLAAWLLWRAERKRLAAAERFAGTGMVGRLSPSRGAVRPWIKGGLLLAGMGLLLAAGARPRFGVYFEKISQRGADVMVLLDVSRSMSAEDVAPSRLERAKSDIRDLLERLIGDRAGLVVFAGRPVVKVPLTSDMGFLQSVLESVDVGSAPRGGTLIGDGIRKCLEAMPRAPDRDQVIVLITDGEDHDSYPLDAAKQAAERGVKIFAVGLGDSREGARIPLRGDAGRLAYLKDQGQEHWSKVNEGLLKEIALATQGAYIPAGTRAYDLGQIYTDHLANLARSEYYTERRKLYREQFQLLAALGLLLLVVEMLIPAYRRARAMAIIAWGLLLFSGDAHAASPQAKVQEGIGRYVTGDYPGAALAFEEADKSQPDDLRIAFDRGTALAAKGDTEKATELLQKAALAPDVALAARSRYNLGCLAAGKAKARFGEHPEDASAEVRKEGLTLVLEAIGHYRDCLRLEPEHADARYNLESLRLWVKHIEALWAERDRKQQRDEMDLLGFLVMLHGRQAELRAVVRGLTLESDSPQRRQAVGETQTAQRQLADEIKPLRAKIDALTTGGQGAAPPQGKSPPAVDEQLKKGVEALLRVADEAGKAIRAAADLLGAGKLEPARDSQAEVMAHLDRIYGAVAPLPAMLTRSMEAQQTVIARTEPHAEPAKPGVKPDASPAAVAYRAAELADGAFDQQFVARWAGLLAPKAEQELKSLASVPAAPAAKPAAKPDEAAAARKAQEEALRRAMEKAVLLGPKAAAAARKATGLLDEQKPHEALPVEQEALKLLKEIAEALPKEPPQQDPKNDQHKDQNKGQKPPEQKKDDDRKSGTQPPKPQKAEMSPEQAEAALRQVRQRQQERDRKERLLQNRLYQPQPVDKDW